MEGDQVTEHCTVVDVVHPLVSLGIDHRLDAAGTVLEVLALVSLDIDIATGGRSRAEVAREGVDTNLVVIAFGARHREECE